VQTIDEVVTRQLSVPTQNATLSGAFALLALLLVSLGLYGVLSYAVTQRTNEIGVRMALGATSRDILLTFSRRGLALTLAGLVAGLALTAGAVRLMSTLFYDFQPAYIPAVAVVSIVLLTVAALASLIPARRASRVDPMVALQHE
jgi:putative ABC transport system permease protein